jgi:hypothetical protein
LRREWRFATVEHSQDEICGAAHTPSLSQLLSQYWARRGKLEKHHQAILPTKAIFLYPLHPDFKEILTR